MRFYFTIIENTINGENRSVPKAFETQDEAMASYHKAVGNDISAESVIGYVALVFDSNGTILVDDKWGTMEKYVAPTTEAEA